jgi:hypothetical protein
VNLFDSIETMKNIVLKFSNSNIKVNSNTQRNIKKAVSAGTSYFSGSFEDVERSCKLFVGSTKFSLDNKYKKHFLQLCETLDRNKALEVRIANIENKKVGFAIYARSKKRIVLLQLSIDDAGKKIGASHFLISESIKEFSKEIKIFDFEGSNNSGIARFYLSFGGEVESYYHFHRNLSQGVLTKLTP